VRLGHRFPPAGCAEQQAVQPAARGLRDTREGGERGARGRRSAGRGRRGGAYPREGLPRNHERGRGCWLAGGEGVAAAARAHGGHGGAADGRRCG